MISGRKVLAAFSLLCLAVCFPILATAESETPAAAPFPDAWNPDPLELPDTVEGRSAAPAPDSTVAKPVFQIPVFPLPASGREAIRVLIVEHAEKGIVSAGTGILILWRKPDGGTGRADFAPGDLQIRRSGEGFRISGSNGEAIAPAPALRLSPENPVVPLRLNGKSYRGGFDLYSDGGGFQAVNVVPMEQYLRGVVPLEMGRPREKGLEALKAQAVVARTYAYKSMLAAEGSQFFDLRASTQDQVYGGADAEYGLADSAVSATRGIVLLHADTLTRCYYHSTCGGMTASRHEVWGGPPIPYLIAQPDTDLNGIPWCHLSKHMQWEQSWSTDGLAGILRANAGSAGANPVPAFHRIVALNVRERYEDGRVATLEIATDRGAFELHGDKIRFAFRSAPGNSAILRSARFDIAIDGDRVTAHGSGNGHGIGMCQMGALSRSAAGQGYVGILSAYYPGTTIAVVK